MKYSASEVDSGSILTLLHAERYDWNKRDERIWSRYLPNTSTCTRGRGRGKRRGTGYAYATCSASCGGGRPAKGPKCSLENTVDVDSNAGQRHIANRET